VSFLFQAKHQSQSILRHALGKEEEGTEEQHSAIITKFEEIERLKAIFLNRCKQGKKLLIQSFAIRSKCISKYFIGVIANQTLNLDLFCIKDLEQF